MTNRENLPTRRLAETFELEVSGLRYVCTIGRFPDGRIAEIFLNNHKSNSMADMAARDAAITFSIAVQHGADPDVIRHALCRDSHGRPSGPLGAAVMGNEPHRHWHIVIPMRDSGQRSAERLGRHRFESYCPMLRVLKPIPARELSQKQRNSGARPKRPALVPLFPGYIFVRFDVSDDRWHHIFDIFRIRGLVCAENLPPRIDDAMIEEIRKREVDGALPGSLLVGTIFKIGDRVKLASGPFQGFHGQIECLDEKAIQDLDEDARVCLLLPMLGRDVRVDVRAGDMRKQPQ